MPATFPNSQLQQPDGNTSSEAIDSHERLGRLRNLSVDTTRGGSTVRFHSNQNTSESMMHLDNASTSSVKWPSTPSSTSVSAHPTATTLRRPSIISITSRPSQITGPPYKSSPIGRHLGTAGTVVSHRFDELFDPTADDGPDSPSDLDENELLVISSPDMHAADCDGLPSHMPELSLIIWHQTQCMDVWDTKRDASITWPGQLRLQYSPSQLAPADSLRRLQVKNVNLLCHTIDLYGEKLKQIKTKKAVVSLPFVHSKYADHHGGRNTSGTCIHLNSDLQGPHSTATVPADGEEGETSTSYSWTVDICAHVPMVLFQTTQTRCFRIEAVVWAQLDGYLQPVRLTDELLFGISVLRSDDVLCAGNVASKDAQTLKATE
ncbi:hypothetical protein PILCRDRAFT_9859 [Piloderma croceum F 1598]|uniref:Uncharacterized protein n=1 Tax=Piloderma croceum (strain F 1598) TaxID=765440 RepID=A0A0C3BRK6_PILCF|nr:hypothetical protein PILCRDRAFT_9859 [Piloderma croceum F 1598]